MKHALDFDEIDELAVENGSTIDRAMTLTTHFKQWFSAFILRNDSTQTQASSESTDFI